MEGICRDRVRLGYSPLTATGPDKGGLQMVSMVSAIRLRVLNRVLHTDPMFFLHHAVRSTDSFVEGEADVFVA